MESAPPIPLIAIVGRPNVGKSTLFNRYAGHKRALVQNEPGITRDRIAEEIEINGRRVLLVDTAGLDRPVGRAQGNRSGDLDQAVQAQARAAVADADAVLFLVDGQTGLLPEDEAIAKTLRRTQKPLLVAVNKIDVPQHRERVTEFHQLGMEPVCAVSAEHGTGSFEALELLVAALPPPAEGEGEEQEEGVRIALVGRPNVGKSSLTNRLLGEDRVVVSEVPGTTRDAVDIRFEVEGRPFVLVDTAGLRRPGRRTRTAERGSALMTVRAVERAQVVLILIDSDEGFTDQDAAVANLVRERGRAAVLLANKWDLVPGEEAERLGEAIEHGIRFMSDTPILRISAKTGFHLGRVLDAALGVLASASREIPTAELNRWLEETVRKHEPSLARKGQKRRRLLKFFYATQTGTCPPTFVLFCTEPQAIQTSYKRFLENQLRAAFGFEGSPIRVRLRARNERA